MRQQLAALQSPTGALPLSGAFHVAPSQCAASPQPFSTASRIGVPLALPSATPSASGQSLSHRSSLQTLVPTPPLAPTPSLVAEPPRLATLHPSPSRVATTQHTPSELTEYIPVGAAAEGAAAAQVASHGTSLEQLHPSLLRLDVDLLAEVAAHLSVVDVLTLGRACREALALTSCRAVWVAHLAAGFGGEAMGSHADGDGRTLFLKLTREAWLASREPRATPAQRRASGILLRK